MIKKWIKNGTHDYLLLEQKMQGRMLGKGYHNFAVAVTSWLLRIAVVSAVICAACALVYQLILALLPALAVLFIVLFCMGYVMKSTSPAFRKQQKETREKEFEHIRQVEQQRINNENQRRQNEAMGTGTYYRP